MGKEVICIEDEAVMTHQLIMVNLKDPKDQIEGSYKHSRNQG